MYIQHCRSNLKWNNIVPNRLYIIPRGVKGERLYVNELFPPFLHALRVLVNEDVLHRLVCFGGDMTLAGDDGGRLVLLNLTLESNVGVKNNTSITRQ